MTKEQIIGRLLNDDCDTIQQWVMQGCYEDLFEFMRGVMAYEYMSDEALMKRYDERQTKVDYELNENDVEFMEDAR